MTNPTEPLTDAELAEMKRCVAAAHQMVSDLCNKRREWIMSIPSRQDYDPDLVIGEALRCNSRLIAEVERLRAEIAKLKGQGPRGNMSREEMQSQAELASSAAPASPNANEIAKRIAQALDGRYKVLTFDYQYHEWKSLTRNGVAEIIRPHLAALAAEADKDKP